MRDVCYKLKHKYMTVGAITILVAVLLIPIWTHAKTSDVPDAIESCQSIGNQAVETHSVSIISNTQSMTSVRRNPIIFRWPAEGRLTSGFGYRQHPMGGGGKFHRGIDIAAEQGTEIYAAQTGRVVHAGWNGLLGKCVIIQHTNDYVTYYGHCSKILIKPNQWVDKGQVIARVGSTGHSTGPHLHFEIHKNGVPVNPMNYLPYSVK